MNTKRLTKVIVLCGSICSGKTYTSNLISKALGLPVASFGKYLKYYCESNNLPTDRKSLQDIGEKFVGTTPEKFLDDVVNYFVGESNSIIIEGVRHLSIFRIINNIAETKVGVFVEADDQTRYKRYSNREKDADNFKTFEQFVLINQHPVELEIQSLKSLCNINIDSTKPLDDNFFKSL